LLPALKQIEGKYEILRKLGEGGMGAVYLVRHRMLEELRVVKVLRTQFQNDRELRERFFREARVATQLRHPNIAQIHELDMDSEGVAFIVMEFIRGVTFEDLASELSARDPGLIVGLAIEALRALAFLHAKGFVHRDISPDNLMLSHDFEGKLTVKLLDLGIVKIISSEQNVTGTHVFLGKFRYAAPEQLSGVAVDERSDIYSFGVMLYELLTGVYPIEGRDMRSIMAGHLLHPPIAFETSDPGRRIPEQLRDTVRKALQKNAEDRLSKAVEFSRQLSSLRLPVDPEVENECHRILLEADKRISHQTSSRVGSTQDRLNGVFDLATATPPRGAVPSVGGAATAIDATAKPGALSPWRELERAERAIAGEHLEEAAEALERVSNGALDQPTILNAAQSLREVLKVRLRSRGIRLVCAKVDELIARRRLDEGQAALREGLQEFGVEPALEEAGSRLEAVARKERALHLVDSARARLEKKQYLDALDLANRALEFDSRLDAARSLSEEARKGLHELRKDQEKREQVDRETKEIQKLAEADRWKEARERFEALLREVPSHAALSLLVHAVEQSEERAKRREAQQYVSRAEKAFRSGALPEATALLEEAARIGPLPPEGVDLGNRVAEAHRIAAARKHAESIILRFESALSHEDLDGALLASSELARLFEESELEQRYSKRLKHLELRLEQLSRDEHAKSEAVRALSETGRHLEARDWEAAEEQLRIARSRFAELESRVDCQLLRDDWTALSRQTLSLKGEVIGRRAREAIAKQDFEEAGAAIDLLRSVDGLEDMEEALRQSLAIARREAERRIVESARPAEPSATVSGVFVGPLTPETPRVNPEDPPRSANSASVSTLDASQSLRRPANRKLLAGMAVCVIAVLLVLLSIRIQGHDGSKIASGSTSNVAALPPPTSVESQANPAEGHLVGSTLPTAETRAGLDQFPPGRVGATVVLDSQPWAEVTRLTGPDGMDVALPSDRTTPLRLILPPGSYRVQAANSALGVIAEQEFKLSPGQEARIELRILGAGAEDYARPPRQ
jgi:serine/threonine protein kinase